MDTGAWRSGSLGACVSGANNGRRRFCLVLLKPTHYCDDGYPITWYRSAIPSNSLACVYGIARELADDHVLGDDVDIEIHAIDEANTCIRPAHIAGMIRSAGAGMVMLIGVQSNQTPRALDIARPLREAGIQIAIGGFHMSGVISMIGGDDAHLREAQAMGLSIFAGEAEGRLGDVLKDAYAGTLKPLYNFMNDLPGIDGAPIPFLGRERVKRTGGSVTSLDAGRGCPYPCSFCTIINVQGRKSRRRTPNDIERIIRANVEQGLFRFFITDDNFARNKDWEIILDRLIHLREVEKLNFSFIIQVDTLCHRLPNFIAKCARAGVKKVFIGLENINPDNLRAAKKRQNKITEYRTMLLAWQKAGVLTYAGYITGFPGDTAESIIRDVEIIKKELPIDVLEFFYLTPLPGSEDHQKMFRAGAWMDPDLNKYDLYHVTAGHPKMSREEWDFAYREAWRRYYSFEHCETIMRRAAALRAFGNTLFAVSWFKGCIEIEDVHPIEGGLLRIKDRLSRRPTMPMEPAWRFYPRYFAEVVSKTARWVWLYGRLRRIYLRIKHDPKRYEYTDLAITPVADDEAETHQMFQTDSGQAFLGRCSAASTGARLRAKAFHQPVVSGCAECPAP
ncbi:MAG: radical SAM protein [Rhizobiales bacterium]|nr:radical SAM protein [Hyphomicrobiales bacterium]